MYVNAFCAAVPNANKEAYFEQSRFAGEIMKEHGALRYVDAWGDDVPAGAMTSFLDAVKCGEDETVVLGWAEWPDKKACDAGTKKFMADPRLKDFKPPFDGKRMIWGSFSTMVDL